MVVTKDALMMRDGNAELMPMELESELFKGTVKVKPILLGDFNEVQAKNLTDWDVIQKFLVEPKITKDEFETMPVIAQREIVKLIFMTSGMTKDEAEKGMRIGFEMLAERLGKKNSEGQ